MPEELVPVEIPLGTQHLWQWFWELDEGRTMGGFGLNPLAYSEILAWCELTAVRLSPPEVFIIKKMDIERLKKV